jgi:hypothetical protein
MPTASLMKPELIILSIQVNMRVSQLSTKQVGENVYPEWLLTVFK